MSDPATPNDALVTATWQDRAAKEREWQKTPIGKAFRKFEVAHSRYWQQDNNEFASNKRLSELDEACRKARAEFLALLTGG